MTLAVGSAIGPYEIVAPLGAGGMGEVYRARDPRLGREVAIKVLPEELSRDPERLRRFEKEARAAAALNHPNILDVHDTGVEEGVPYIVSELLEGETLRERLRAAALPPRKAIEYAVQIAQGLAAAHEKEILHRDLKPENLFLTRDGRIKILDFGLAKLRGPLPPAGSSLSQQETVPRTSPGVVLGTVGYMSPEQVRGQEVDQRTDIFSFGAVLYEMLSGRRAFRGETTVQTMNAILTEDPPALSSVSPALPPVLEGVVNRCLEKRPEDRFHSAHDLGIALQTISGSASETPWEGIPPSATRSRWSRWKAGLAAVGLVSAGALVVLVALWIAQSGREKARPTSRTLSRFSLALPEGVGTGIGPDSDVAISPDGRQIVFVGWDGEKTRLYRRVIDAVTAEPIPGTDGALMPFFSSGGTAIGFRADDVIKRVPLRGGAPIAVIPASWCFGGDWGPDGTIVYALCPDLVSRGDVGGLKQVSATGGVPESLTRAEAVPHQFPRFLGDRRAILFTQRYSPGNLGIALLDLDSGEERVIIEKGSGARYVPTGHIVYGLGGALWAVPFDAERLDVTGPAVQLVEDVSMLGWLGVVHFAISSTGTLVYAPGGLITSETHLAWVDRSGSLEPLPIHGVTAPRVSPDGTRLLFAREAEEAAIHLYDLERGVERRVTTEGGRSWWSVWTPDGRDVVTHRYNPADGFAELWKKPVDGSGPAEQMTQLRVALQPVSFSADGSILAFQESNNPETGFDIWTLSPAGDRTPRPFLRERFDELHPAMSPNGRWLAYASNETGRYEVSVRPYPGPGGVVTISADGGWEPTWSPDGTELFFRAERKILVVSFDPGAPAPRPGKPRVVVEGPFRSGVPYGRNYDVAPDGRFLVVVEDEPPPPPTEYRVVLNWFEELERLVPTD